MRFRLLAVYGMTILILSSFQTSSSAPLSTNDIDTDAIKLTIITRMDSTVYSKYAEYFSQSELGTSVGITDPGQIEFIAATTTSAYKTALSTPVIGGDIAWGGGNELFNELGNEEYLRSLTDQSLIDLINTNISTAIGNTKTIGSNDNGSIQWVSSAISSYGFTVNNETLENRGLEFPTSWEDLASPNFYTSGNQFNIGIGNAPDSTSMTKIYQIILEVFGWDKGWDVLYSMAGNSKVYGGAVETRYSVINGETAVALTIDFYGVIAMNENANLQYVIPDEGTLILTDPIAISASTDNLEEARAFMKYVLSDEGQALLLDNRINRLPVRQDSFTTAQALASTDPDITTTNIELMESLYLQTLQANPIIYNSEVNYQFEEVMKYHFESTITQLNTNFRSTWITLVEEYNQEEISQSRFNKLKELFTNPAITMYEAINLNDQIINDAEFRLDIQSEWEDFAEDKLNQLQNLISNGSQYIKPTLEIIAGITQYDITQNQEMRFYIESDKPVSIQLELNDGTIIDNTGISKSGWYNYQFYSDLFSSINEQLVLVVHTIYDQRDISIYLTDYSKSGTFTLTTPSNVVFLDHETEEYQLIWDINTSTEVDYQISNYFNKLDEGRVISDERILYQINISSFLNSEMDNLQFTLYANSSEMNISSTIRLNFIGSLTLEVFFGLNSNGFTWQAINDDNGNYIIYQDGIIVESGIWMSGEEKMYNFEEGLSGTYNFTLEVNSYDMEKVIITEIVNITSNSETDMEASASDNENTGVRLPILTTYSSIIILVMVLFVTTFRSRRK